MAIRNSPIVDKELILREHDEAPLSTTASTVPFNFDATNHRFFKVILPSSGYSGYVDSTAQWELDIEVSDSEGGTYLSVLSSVISAETGNYEYAFSGNQINQILTDASWIRVTATKVGTPGDLSFGAFLSC